MERKTFIRFIGAGVATGSLITFLNACQKSNSGITAPSEDFTLDLSSPANAVLLKSGGAIDSNQVIVVNNNGTYIAISDICTHQGCTVSFNSSSSEFICPCHGGTYSITGAVIAGPPPAPLKQYNVARNGNILHITG